MDQNQELSEGGFGTGFWSWFFFKKWNLFKGQKQISICFATLAAFFFILAIVTFVVFLPMQQVKVIYADFNGCYDSQRAAGVVHKNDSSRCEAKFSLTKQMKAPIHFLYYIQNIYVNHRKYLSSYSKEQLQGQTLDIKVASKKCFPFIFNKDLGKNISWSGKLLDPDAIASPCGYKAFLTFNDTFKLKYLGQNKVIDKFINEKGISQYQGIGIDFKSRNPSEEWINPEDQHFMIWMQTQSLMTQKKLWGRIQENLPPGDYSIVAENNYHINQMRISKGIQLVQSSSLGGKSLIIPILFSIFTILCIIYSIVLQKKFKNLDALFSERQSLILSANKKK